MLLWRVAPDVVSLAVVRRAEVGGGDADDGGAGQAPWRVDAH